MIEHLQMSDTDELLQKLLHQTSEHAVILLNSEGCIVAWYGGAEKAFGYTADEVLGKSVSILFTAESLEKGMDRYEMDVARTNIEAEDDRWMVRKDGSRFWAAGVLTPIKNAQGDLVGFGKVLRDRTDMRATTETLFNQNQSLQQTDLRKNEFISTLAHELLNPLSSMVHSIELLKMSASDSEDLQLVASTLQREAAAMRRLIGDLTDATRASAGKVTLKKQRVELCPIVESAVEAFRQTIESHDQTLHVILPTSSLEVAADSDRLRQVFCNLVKNAVHYTPSGGTIWIKVSLEAEEAVVKVADDGAGISPELLPRIFDLFTQAEFASENPEAGLGIGLSVVKDLTQLHGGTVQVRSDGPGKGSEFSVRLPLSADSAEAGPE